MGTTQIRKTFPFLRLPPELRNRIYHLALCAPGEICPAALEAKVRLSSNEAVRLSISTGLLGACKETQAEAAPVLYGSNIFRFARKGRCVSFSGMYPFLVKMGRRNRLHLRHLTVCIPDVPRWMWEQYDGMARVLGDSFDLLSLNHGLHALELNFSSFRSAPIGHAYRTFFTLGFRVVEKLRKVKNIKQLLLTGDRPPYDFTIRRVKSTIFIASLIDEMLVGKEKESPSRNDRGIASLEKSLEGLAASRQDPAVNVEAPGTVMQSLRSLQNNLITKTQVAEIVKEKLLLLQGRLPSVAQTTEITKALVTLERHLAARLIGEKASRQDLVTSVAGLALKAYIARTIKAEMITFENREQHALTKIGETVIAKVREMFEGLGWTEEVAEMVLEELDPLYKTTASKEQVEDVLKNLAALKKNVDELSSRI